MSAVKKAYLELEGYGHLHYRCTDNPALPCIVLLHQAPSSSEMFEPLMAALAADFYLWAPDMPGFGNSPADTEPMTIEGLAATCQRAISALGLSNYALFGHHTGTAVAVEIARANNSVKQLLLCGPALLSEDLRAGLPSRAQAFELRDDGQHLLQHWQRMRDKDPGIPLALRQREMILAVQMDDRYQQAYQAVADFDFAAALKDISCPTMLCAGSNDLLASGVTKAAATLQGADQAVTVSTEIIPQAGSYICETHVAEIAAVIKAHSV